MTNEMALMFALGAALLAVIYGLVMTTWVLGRPAGNEKMQEIAAAIQLGANAYMNRQYATIGVVGVVLFLALGAALGWPSAFGFAVGAISTKSNSCSSANSKALLIMTTPSCSASGPITLTSAALIALFVLVYF